MKHLSIYAGADALHRLRADGFLAEHFGAMLGASGGPKWFVLYGLDRYLFGEFYKGRDSALYTLGSSAGAWRMCALATADPVAALERLASLYSSQDYSSQPTVTEITDKARVMLRAVLGEYGEQAIVGNPVFKTHIIAVRVRGVGASNNRFLQSLALSCSALANAASRKTLSWFFQRTVFSTAGADSPWAQLKDLDTQHVPLTEANLFSAMMASGSIPFALTGERDIHGARSGLYWDGGITDYHFDLPYQKLDKLVLYPHFSARVVPGWFDKHVPWRKPHQHNYRNVVLLAPSPEFVAQLKYQKIPDRSDFKTLDYHSRLQYWKQVLDLSRYIADDFAQLVETGKGLDKIQPLKL